MAERLKPFLIEGLIWVAGRLAPEPVGFLLALPDYNIRAATAARTAADAEVVRVLPYVLGWKCPPR